MSILGLKSGYTIKYGLSPRDFPWAQAIFYPVFLLLPNTLAKYSCLILLPNHNNSQSPTLSPSCHHRFLPICPNTQNILVISNKSKINHYILRSGPQTKYFSKKLFRKVLLLFHFLVCAGTSTRAVYIWGVTYIIEILFNRLLNVIDQKKQRDITKL